MAPTPENPFGISVETHLCHHCPDKRISFQTRRKDRPYSSPKGGAYPEEPDPREELAAPEEEEDLLLPERASLARDKVKEMKVLLNLARDLLENVLTKEQIS